MIGTSGRLSVLKCGYVADSLRLRVVDVGSFGIQARIALLEGQRRAAENLKVDLLRRVKMLEFALRQER